MMTQQRTKNCGARKRGKVHNLALAVMYFDSETVEFLNDGSNHNLIVRKTMRMCGHDGPGSTGLSFLECQTCYGLETDTRDSLDD